MAHTESTTLLPGEYSRITPGIPTFLAENVEGFQQCVKELLKLIKEHENLSEMTLEDHLDKKDKLTSHVAELSRMHGALVDHQVQLIEEFSKSSPSPITKQQLDSSDSNSLQVTQMFTPDQASNAHKFRTPIGFDLLLSSGGGGSYASRKEASESSFSLSSDSDSESFMSINKLLVSPVNGDAWKVKETKVPEVLLQKISDLEEEVVTLNTKIQTLADENSNLKQEIEQNELIIETQNADFQTEKIKVIEMEKQLADLNLIICDSNHVIKTMGEKLSGAEDEILILKHELSCEVAKLGSTLQEVSSLEKQLDSEKQSNLRLHEEVSLCVADISARDDQITELNTKVNQSQHEISLLKNEHKAKEFTWNTDILRLKTELTEKHQSVHDLNKTMDSLKLKKDEVTAQLDTLRAEKSCQDDLVKELEARLNTLQLEHARVLSSFDNAENFANGLKLKVTELESEVERQREVMLDRAEEKREAIRQLSFSLEHYMSGYKQLRHAFVAGNRSRAFFT